MVVSQPIWQTEVVLNQDSSVGPVHVRGFYLGSVTVPVGPVQVTGGKTQSCQFTIDQVTALIFLN